jgi:cytochrome c peroxidase
MFAPSPLDNAASPSRVALGERLFFDPVLSENRRISCASCHQPMHAFSDTSAISRGSRGTAGRRNAPSVLNVAYRPSLFWDGRAQSLEQQVLQPIQDSLEMALSPDTLEARLRGNSSYRREFQRAFGGEPTAKNVARALAAYLRTLRSGNASVDRFRNGDTQALSSLAQQGLELFEGKARCTSCHLGSLFTDADFHNTGIGWRAGGLLDSGRASMTRRPDDLASFLTPSLRNVALTPPYMHDGSMRTLDDVIEFYDKGGNPNPGLDDLIRPIGLSSFEKRALAEYLRALTGAQPSFLARGGPPNRPRGIKMRHRN